MNGAGLSRRSWILGLVVVSSHWVVAETRGDRIVLRGGGTIPGKVLSDPSNPEMVTVILERGKTPMRLSRARIVEVIAEPGPLDAYVLKRLSAPASAQGQFDLGSWCEANTLRDLAGLHYEAALAIDGSFAPAHEKLGHKEVNGVWLSGDALRQAQGLVKYKGKWITTEERDQREQDGALAVEQSGMARRIKGWRDAIALGTDDRRREAEAQLLAVREPTAVDPLLRVLGNDEEPFRKLLASVLGAIPGPESTGGLVKLLLREESEDVRGSIMNELTRKNDPEAAKSLVKALPSRDPAVVNRAAWGLSHLNAVTAVPSLVNVLFTQFTRMELPSENGEEVPSQVNPGVAGLPAGFGQTYSPPPIAYNGSSVAYLTGPVVGPGAVAFGATSAPVVPLDGGPLAGISSPGAFFGGPSMSGLNLGARGLGGSRGPVPRPVTYTFRNTEVLAALTKLTGQDFGYDLPAWKNWLRSDYKPEPSPARSVPQP